MKVDGYEISDKVFAAVSVFLLVGAEEGVATRDVEIVTREYLRAEGIVPEGRISDVALRLANRVLQKNRKAGSIKTVRGRGTPVWVLA